MLNLDKNQLKVFVLMAAVILILFSIVLLREFKHDRPAVEMLDSKESLDAAVDMTPDTETEEESSRIQKIKIYIAGAVNSPGVIEIKDGSRLADAIALVGGASEDADLNAVNLAVRLADEEMYFIPQKGEVPQGQYAEGLSSISQNTAEQKININLAEGDALETLPGIGPVKAQKIIDYRKEKGPFSTIEAIKEVSGIGDKTYEAIKDLITVK